MSKELTPAQETAERLAEEYRVRGLTIPENDLKNAIGNKWVNTVLNNYTDNYKVYLYGNEPVNPANTHIEDEHGYTIGLYYTVTFFIALWEHTPQILLDHKEKRLLSLKRLEKTQKMLEDRLKITNSITWTFVKSNSIFAVSGTVFSPTQANNIYATNGYVDIIYIRIKEKPDTKERLHKQPRNYLKTTAQLVGKSAGENLFSIPALNKEPSYREVISRNTAILGQYLIQLWQQNGQKDALVINNLSPIAEMMNNTNHEVKIYLLYLGGYTYPIIDTDDKGLTITMEQLFKVKFHYGLDVKSRHEAGETSTVGTGLTTFIKDEPIKSITITPSPLFIKAIEGKGLGNVLAVNDKFIELALTLTDIAYKIYAYSAANKPSQTIAEDNLIKHLGLDKQTKAQGRPRVRQTILKGLQELQDKGHVKSYSFDQDRMMYSFSYSDKFIRHPKAKKDQE